MSRSYLVIKKKPFLVNSIQHNNLILKFINYLMKKGKKSVAENLLFKALRKIKLNHGQHPFKLFYLAIKKSLPYIELKPTIRRGRTFQIPTPISYKRQLFLAIKNIIAVAKERNEKSMSDKLSLELINIAKGQSKIFKIKQELYKSAKANRAYSHMRLRKKFKNLPLSIRKNLNNIKKIKPVIINTKSLSNLNLSSSKYSRNHLNIKTKKNRSYLHFNNY
jgi:small subunit ribosomal protein S7